MQFDADHLPARIPSNSEPVAPSELEIRDILLTEPPFTIEQQRSIRSYVTQLENQVGRLQSEEIVPARTMLERRNWADRSLMDLTENFLTELERIHSYASPSLIAILRRFLLRLPHHNSSTTPFEFTPQWTSGFQAAITDLDDELAHLLELLEKRKYDLQNEITELQSLLNPFTRLSPEVVSEIFMCCQRGSIPYFLPHVLDSFDPREGPLLLTRVCRRWRHIAISTPHLWTTIALMIDSPRLSRSKANLAALWLTRSASCQLVVRLATAGTALGSFRSFTADPSTRVALSQSARWKEFHWIMYHTVAEAPWRALEVALADKPPNLQEISVISGEDYIRPNSPSFSTTAFSALPSLRCFRLDVGQPLSAFNLNPRKNITSLELNTRTISHFLGIKEVLHVLESYPNLLDLRVSCGLLDPKEAAQLSIVTNNSLQRLVIKAVSQFRNIARGLDLDALFSRIVLPSLRAFTIYGSGEHRQWSLTTLTNLFSRGDGRLEELFLGGEDFSWEEVCDCLAFTPRLKVLRLHSSNGVLTDDILLRLELGKQPIIEASTTETLSQPALVPHLQVLEVECIIDASAEGLLRFASTRAALFERASSRGTPAFHRPCEFSH